MTQPAVPIPATSWPRVVGLAASAALNVGSAAEPDFRDLDDLSKGQKATALLLILLATVPGPLIVDQPEAPDAFRRRRYLYGF